MIRRGHYRAALASALLVVLANGCPPLAEATPCRTHAQCPEGFACSMLGGYCVASDASAGGDGGAADAWHDAATDARRDAGAGDRAGTDASSDAANADGAVGDGGAVSDGGAGAERSYDAADPGCGTTGALVDDFESTPPLLHWTMSQGNQVTLAQTAGALRFDVAAGGAGSDQALVTSWVESDLWHDAIVVRVASATLAHAAAGSVMGYLEFCPATGTCHGVGHDGTTYFGYTYDGTIHRDFQHPYDPDLHRWWRIDARSDAIAFSVSSNGSGWSTFDSRPLTGLRDLGSVHLGVDRYGDPGQPVAIAFDDFNLDRAPRSWCAAASLRDDFGAAGLQRAWRVPPAVPASCTVRVAGSRLTLDVVAGADASCQIETRSAFDLRNSQISVAVIDAPTTPGVMTGIFLWHPQAEVALGVVDGGVVFESPVCQYTAYSSGASVDALRISHDGTMYRFWRHGPGLDWTDLGPLPCAIPGAHEMQIAIGTRSRGSAASGLDFSAMLDDYNLVP